MEDRPCGVYVVFSLTQPDADWMVASVTSFGGLEHDIERPAICLRRAAGRIHCHHINPCELFHQIDARARAFDLTANACRDCDPMSACACQIPDCRIHLTIDLDEIGHDVINWLQVVGVIGRLPAWKGKDVVTRLCLRLSRDR